MTSRQHAADVVQRVKTLSSSEAWTSEERQTAMEDMRLLAREVLLLTSHSMLEALRRVIRDKTELSREERSQLASTIYWDLLIHEDSA